MEPTIHLVAPSAPPKICGVGDHSLLLGRALAALRPVRVHCGQIQPHGQLPGLDAAFDFDSRFPWTLGRVARDPALCAGDQVLFQYTNFAYGRYGFNPWLAPFLRKLRRKGLVVATMFHETYMPAQGIKIRMMGAWQRVFFRDVGRNSDVCFFSVDPWTERYSSWFPDAEVATLRVGSNIPLVPADRDVERARLGIAPDEIALVVFGGTHPSRLFDWIVSASRALEGAGIRHRVVHVGPDRDEVATKLAGAPLLELGTLPPEEVSRALRVADLFLSPISDGASSRRGSLLAGLQHGLCCVTTQGASTDHLFRLEGGRAVVYASSQADFADRVVALSRDPAVRAFHSAEASRFHASNFSWESIAENCLGIIGSRSARPSEGS